MEHTTNYNLNKPLDSENYDIAHQNENMDLIEEALTEISTDYLDKATYDTNKNGAADKADKLTTARTISLTGDVTGSGKFDGSANLSISAKVGTTAKTTPVDADSAVIIDSAASSVAKRTTWANIKAFLKTYFGTLYARKPADITSTSTNTSVADGTTTHTHALALGAVTNTKMATMPANTIKGNDGTTALAPQDLTAAEVLGILQNGTIQNVTITAPSGALTSYGQFNSRCYRWGKMVFGTLCIAPPSTSTFANGALVATLGVAPKDACICVASVTVPGSNTGVGACATIDTSGKVNIWYPTGDMVSWRVQVTVLFVTN